MPCIIVNLPFREDRRNLMQSQSVVDGCSFFPAVQVSDFGAEKASFTSQPVDALSSKFSAARLRGVLGCFASQLRILQHFQGAHAVDRLLVLEDDVRVRPEALRFIDELVGSGRLEGGWDVIRFSVHDKYKPSHSEKKEGLFHGRRPMLTFRSEVLGQEVHVFESRFGDWGTQAVLYNGASVGRIVGRLTGSPLTDIDAMLAMAGERRGAEEGLRTLYCVVGSGSEHVFASAKMRTDIPKTLIE